MAEDYPTRTVTDIVASTPGGGTDIVSRVYAEQLSKQMGQPFIVENIAGAGSLTGTVAGRACHAGWLHVANRTERQHGGQSKPVRQSAVRSGQRFRAGRHVGAISVRAGRQQQLSGAFGKRTDRHGQREAGRDQLCIGRQRHRTASVDGTVQADDRHQSRARAVSRRGAGLYRCHVRPGSGLYRQSRERDLARSKAAASVCLR